ncbi:TetR/AcrR family transcriptional regulator [Pseudonocardia spinosispora]|uniref:TetR/AcrR family transcriptional regulator n=1 Tax=Pseudonocardia spinosispora TaxID=103441 RepID=UPI0004252375|nr:TetR/AcrR family transcriptional regulator [Pseudonocardia spinosispora]
MTAVRPYRGVSAEDRRAQRREKVKSACLDVVGDNGVTDLTVEAVSARAGLTKRYFYEGFADLDALLAEVIDDIFTELLAEILAALDATDPTVAHRAHTIVSLLIDFFQRDVRRARLYVEAPGQPTLRARRDVAFDLYTRLLVEHLHADSTPRRSEPWPPTTVPDRRRALAALIVVAGVTEAMTAWLRGAVELDRHEIVDEITRVMIAALE